MRLAVVAALLPSLIVAARPALAEPPTPGTEPEYGDRGGVFRGFEPHVTLTGSLRGRAEFDHALSLGRRLTFTTPDPFVRWVPLQDRADAESCASGTCPTGNLSSADLRLRLSPTLEVSEWLAIHVTLDALGDTLAGEDTSPTTSSSSPAAGMLGTTQRGSRGAIVLRRAWGEVKKGDQLAFRFGRMGNHFGLGIVDNSGDRFDDDLASDVDRAELAGHLGPVWLSAAWDFASTGAVDRSGPGSLPSDATTPDDLRQFTFRALLTHARDQREALLEREQAVLDLGLQEVERVQGSATLRSTDPTTGALLPPAVVPVDARTHTLGAWSAFRYGPLRLEAEGALVLGHVGNVGVVGAPAAQDVHTVGAAFESDVDLCRGFLFASFDAGFASGDAGVRGLSYDTDPFNQLGHIASTFAFHPSYRVDQLLWRRVLGQVTGAYYLRPGVLWRPLESDYGELLQLRAHGVYSRASKAAQAPGGSADLGVEIDLGADWRSASGPAEDDGFVLTVEWAYLFPMAGLGYSESDPLKPSGFAAKNAWALRTLVGIVY